CTCLGSFLSPEKRSAHEGLRGFPRSPHAGGYLLCFRYYGHGVALGNVCGHGVTGTTSPPLLILSMQFFSISWATRVGFPEIVYPSIASWSHAVVIRAFIVMLEHRSYALPSTDPYPVGGNRSSFN